MIKPVNVLPYITCESVAMLRIESLFNTYNTQLARFYCQTVDNEVTAVISHFGQGFNLACTKLADFEELESFFAIFGTEVFCDCETAEFLNPKSKQIVPLLKFSGGDLRLGTEDEMKLSCVYKLLENGNDGDISLPPFEDWYTDFCARVNHQSADCFVKDGAVAVAGFVTKKGAFITGVAVAEKDRRKGEGSKVLKGLIAKLKKSDEKRDIFATARGETVRFYLKNGFEICGSCAVLKY